MAWAATGFKVVSGVASGISAMSAGIQEAANDESMARLAETQALQRDTLSRGDLDDFLAGLRAARAANGLSAFSPNAMVLEKEARETMDRDRLINRASDRQRAANFRASAKARRSGARLSLVTGIAKGGVPLAEYGFEQGWWGNG